MIDVIIDGILVYKLSSEQQIPFHIPKYFKKGWKMVSNGSVIKSYTIPKIKKPKPFYPNLQKTLENNRKDVQNLINRLKCMA